MRITSTLIVILLLLAVPRWVHSLPIFVKGTVVGQVHSHDFTSSDGAVLVYWKTELSSFQLTRGPIVISPGKSETIYVYQEMIGLLLAKGYGPIYILDHRGQGQSILADGDQRDVIDLGDFSVYSRDFEYFLNKIVLPSENVKSVNVISHSMGGLISVLAALEHPEMISSQVLIAPMFDIDFKLGFLNSGFDRIPWLFGKFVQALDMGSRITFSTMPDPKIRYQNPNRRERVMMLNDDDRIATPKVSVNWLVGAISATRKLDRIKSKYKIPTLLIRADRDEWVQNESLEAFSCAAQNCSMISVKGTHSVHMSSESTINKMMEEIFKFLQSKSCERALRK